MSGTIREFVKRRLNLYLAGFQEKNKLRKDAEDYSDKIREPIGRLYDNICFTVAFQAAVICGFFLVMELAEDAAKEANVQAPARNEIFDEYINALNAFFVPSTMSKLKNLLRSFFYDVKGDKAEEWLVVPTPQTFRAVVFSNEMKPDEWPKYRLPLLEIWRPTNSLVRKTRDTQLEKCREQAFKSLYTKQRQEYCRAHKKNEEELDKADWDEVFKVTFENFDGFLSNLGISRQEDRLQKDAAKEIIKHFEMTEPVEPA